MNFALAVAIGYTTASLYSRTLLINEEEDSEGNRKVVILSRSMNTKGLVIRPKKELFDQCKDDPASISKILHTISHAFLKHLPLQTGLEPNEFYESIDIDSQEISIFDNQPGGIGGVLAITDVDNGELSPDYQQLVSTSVDCDIECPSACRACLYVENCGRLNRQLNRKLLGGVLTPV